MGVRVWVWKRQVLYRPGVRPSPNLLVKDAQIMSHGSSQDS